MIFHTFDRDNKIVSNSKHMTILLYTSADAVYVINVKFVKWSDFLLSAFLSTFYINIQRNQILNLMIAKYFKEIYQHFQKLIACESNFSDFVIAIYFVFYIENSTLIM